MTSETLLDLARAACTSLDARVVLEDAIRETGWWDDRIRYPLSNGDDREDFLSELTWPGELGERHAQIVVKALTTPKRSEE